MAIRSVVCPVVVGRDAEVELLRANADAVREAGRTTLVGGEAGIGKTRLAGEAVQLATADGFTVLGGACVEGASAAYAPFVAALRRHTRVLDAAALRALFEGPAELAATLLPEVAAQLQVTTWPGGTAPEDLHAAAWQLLRRLSEPRPVLVVVEDVHWADADTLRLLEHLVAEAAGLRLWVVVTYRSDDLHRRHPLVPVLSRLRRVPLVTEIRLDPLRPEDQRDMISALFGGTVVGDEFVHAVDARTEGNPFFIEELTAVLVERGDIFKSGDDWERRSLDEIEMPPTVRETLLARIARLDPAGVAVLRVAAVAGERIDRAVLVRVAEADESVVDTALVAGLEHQLLVERREGALTRYGFRHALTREALADDLIGPERQSVHRRTAEALQAVHASELDAFAAEIADHAERGGLGEVAASFAIRAGRRAAVEHATLKAAEHFAHALRLMPVDDPGRIALLLEAAEATGTDQDRSWTAAFAREARTLAQAQKNGVAEAQALRHLARDLWREGDSAGARRLTEEALRLVAGHDDWTEASVRSQHIRFLVLSGTRGDHARAREVLSEAIELATRAGNLEALSQLHNSRSLLARDEGEHDEAFELAVRYGRESGSIEALVTALINGGFSYTWIGAVGRGVDWLRQGTEAAERHTPGRDTYPRAGLAWAASIAGDLDEAWGVAEPLRESANVASRMVALHALTEVALLRGDLQGARTSAEAAWELAERSGEGQRIDPALSHLARVRIARDGPEAAEPFVARVLDGAGKPGAWTPATHALVSPDLAHALRESGRPARLEELLAWVESTTTANDTPHNRAALLFCRAERALAMDDPAGARRLFAEAAAAYRAMPCPAREAEALLGAAEAALETGEMDEAGQAATAAARLADKLAAPPLRERADDLLRRARADLVLATVLVTDIVASTERAAALGDRAWRELLERHHAIVRRELRAHRGREVDTAGDGFLASFDSPARGIRAALAIVSALGAEGIGVRAGLHTGECEALDGKLAGIAVHTAARVAAVAGAGEVVVSSTVRDLVAGSGYRFTDRGTHELRGVPGEWRLFAVTP